MPTQRIRFDNFELDLNTGELLKQSQLVRLQDQPARLLILLASRPKEVVTREEIRQKLWGEEEFVEFEHSVNTAVLKIRKALEDNPDQPRIIETLPRKGYRFIAPVEPVEALETVTFDPKVQEKDDHKDFVIPVDWNRARYLFLLAQIPYVIGYLAAFYYAPKLSDYVSNTFPIIPEGWGGPIVLTLALVGFAVRVYLISLVGWAHTDAGSRFHKIFPALAVLDGLWAATPLLVAHKLTQLTGWAGLILMGWLIFGQRTLMQRIAHRG
jgi:DNA-binding winged helix-turn-helix (wHTH) protein